MAQKQGTWRVEILAGQKQISTVEFSIAAISTAISPLKKIRTSSARSTPGPSPFQKKSCPNCGEQISGDKKFCTQCGSPVVVEVRTADLRIPSPARFCGECGVTLDQGLKFCGNCGTPTVSTGSVQPTPPLRPSAVQSVGGPMFAGQENVIGCRVDSGIWRDRRSGLGKYGIYFTQKRIIGVRHGAVSKGTVAGTVAEGTIDLLGEGIASNIGKKLVGGIGSVVGRGIEHSISAGESKHLLENLDKKKDFEAYKQDISFIELRNPSGTMKSGRVVIAMNSGNSIEIQFVGNDNSQELSVLLETFYPQAFRLAG